MYAGANPFEVPPGEQRETRGLLISRIQAWFSMRPLQRAASASRPRNCAALVRGDGLGGRGLNENGAAGYGKRNVCAVGKVSQNLSGNRDDLPAPSPQPPHPEEARSAVSKDGPLAPDLPPIVRGIGQPRDERSSLANSRTECCPPDTPWRKYVANSSLCPVQSPRIASGVLHLSPILEMNTP